MSVFSLLGWLYSAFFGGDHWKVSLLLSLGSVMGHGVGGVLYFEVIWVGISALFDLMNSDR